MDRREYLLGVTGATAMLAGCDQLEQLQGTETEDDADEDEPDPPQVQVVREYYRLLDSGDVAEANELIHPDSPQGEVSTDRAEQYRDELTISVGSVSLAETSGDTATVNVAVRLERTETGETEERSLAVELRETDEGWRLYDSRQREETTGEPDDNEEVANQLQVVSAFGTDIESGEVRTVQLVLKRAPGSAEIDLTRLTVQWVDNSGSYDLTYGPRVSEGTFAIEGVQDNNESLSEEGPILDDAADRALLQVSVPAVRDSGLPEGASASVRLSIASGRSSDTMLQVPDTLVDGEAVQL